MAGAPPLVSVIVPTYNAAPFLPELCRSLQQQTLGDFEVLLGDDGSTDDTATAVAPFLADARFVYHRWDQNRGVNRATTDLLERARGEFWAHPGADDFLTPEFLARRVEIMRAHPRAGVVHGMPLFVDEGGRELADQDDGIVPWKLRRAELEVLSPQDGCTILLQHNIINTPSVLLRTALTKQVLELMRTDWRYAQDWAFWILHAAAGGELVWDARRLSYYRIVRSSLTCNPRHEATRRAEIRLVPLCTLARASSHSPLAAKLWGEWKGALYNLWLRRAWALRLGGILKPEWTTMAADAFHGHPTGARSITAESIRRFPSLALDSVRENAKRRHQAFPVSGLASIDHPYFRQP